VDIEPELGHFISKLQKLQDMPLIGRWEETLANALAESDGNTLHGQQLWTKAKRTGPSNKYVTTNRDFSAIRNDTIQSLMNFMASRLKLGDDLQSSSSSVRAFCNFTAHFRGHSSGLVIVCSRR